MCKMKKIIVIGDTSSTNLGDPILTHSCKYIVEKVAAGQDYSIVEFDIADRPQTKVVPPTEPTPIPMGKKPSRIAHIKTGIVNDVKAIIKWLTKDKTAFRTKLLNVGVPNGCTFVIAGGALISDSLFYALRLNEIVKIAKACNGRVVFNAVGIEKTIYNMGLAKYVVRHYLKQKEVVAFSTRDHVEDVPYISNRKEFCKQIPDSGLFAAEAYGIARKESDTIGLSVISFNAYRSVMQNDERAAKMTPDDLLMFWESILKQFIAEGTPFKILTNGAAADYNLALHLCNRMNLPVQQYLLPLAKTPQQLIEQLSTFKVVIAHRLHALIVSTSLGIPVIPVVWSDKVSVFANMIDNPNAVWPTTQKSKVVSSAVRNNLLSKECVNHIKEQSIEYINSNI